MSDSSSPSDKLRISGKSLIADLRAGVDDAVLKEKYGVTGRGLQSAFKKLVAAGLLSQTDLDARERKERVIGIAWRCPACGKPQTREFAECPECGIIVSKIGRETDKASETPENRPAPPSKEPPKERGYDTSGEWLRQSRGPIAWAVAALLLLAFVAVTAGWLRDAAVMRKTEQNYGPMKKEIARAVKQIQMGLSLNDHRALTKSFVQKSGEIELALNRTRPELVGTLDGATRELYAAQALWSAMITAETGDKWEPLCKEMCDKHRDALLSSNQKAFCAEYRRPRSTFQELEAFWGPFPQRKKEVLLYATEIRQDHWQAFGELCQEAFGLMK